MRIGLIAALRRGADGSLRAALPLCGTNVLTRQAVLLHALGAERIVCLCEKPDAELLRLQQTLEARGAAFHALAGFAALPALVRAEDDLIVMLDGLVPDPAVMRAVFGSVGLPGKGTDRAVATVPADHPLAMAHPNDFERIDAARAWAGVLAMRGAAVQQLEDFPPSADAISLLLRLALQSGTPCRPLATREVVPEKWLLAVDPATAQRHEASLIALAAPPVDWRAPTHALAAALVRALSPKGLAQGQVIASALALALMICGVLAAAFGAPAAGLGAAALGAFAMRVSRDFSGLTARLQPEQAPPANDVLPGAATDALAAITLWTALAPLPAWEPLAATGPIAIGLARLLARGHDSALAALAGDRAAVLFALTLAAVLGFLPEAVACLALGLLAALLLHRERT
jgi:hypothetical protein